jgi:hypothetical protein
MMWQIKKPTIWKQKFAWHPKRIGSVRIWLEKYEVRQVPSSEAIERYIPLAMNPCWLEEFRHGGNSYWRLTTAPMSVVGGLMHEWVDVRPRLRVVA